MTTDATKAVEQFRAMQRGLEFGYHDGYCVIAKTEGMHTN